MRMTMKPSRYAFCNDLIRQEAVSPMSEHELYLLVSRTQALTIPCSLKCLPRSLESLRKTLLILNSASMILNQELLEVDPVSLPKQTWPKPDRLPCQKIHVNSVEYLRRI